MRLTGERARAASLAAALLFAASFAWAQAYPSKPVRLVLPFGAGSGTDILARIVTEDLRQSMGATFVIDNRAGGSGQIAAEVVARAAPDGYTLLLSTNTPHSANPFLFKKLNYDPDKDFAAVARMIYYVFILAVSPNSGVRTVPELIARVKAAPGKTSYAFGNSTGQVNGAYFVSAAKLDSLVVPYKSTVPAMGDIINGQIQWMFVDWAASQGHVKAGRLRALGVMSDKRSSVLPDLPAVGETVPGFDITSWAGIFVPTGTPAAIVQRLSAEMIKAIAKPAVSQRLVEMGLEPAATGPEELTRFVAQQRKSWGAKIKAAGIQPE
jgi:tripartite-type tricarboxylate transporter receptor subunit TctC